MAVLLLMLEQGWAWLTRLSLLPFDACGSHRPWRPRTAGWPRLPEITLLSFQTCWPRSPNFPRKARHTEARRAHISFGPCRGPKVLGSYS